MDLFEYQGKEYLARYGVPVPEGRVATDVAGARAAGDELGYPVVVKAQVQVGGRGKAGGIKVAADGAELGRAASAILGMDLKGHLVRRVWVERASAIERELYASFTLDRAARLHLGMVSAEGGVEIEEVAARTPEAITRRHVDPTEGLGEQGAEALARSLGLDADTAGRVAALLRSLYTCFVEGDADLVEVNPLVVTEQGEVVALDAKVTLDDNASFRHPDWQVLAAAAELDPREAMAKEKGLNYIGLEGEVGIIANGAGLAMSTLDVVHQAGGRAANFLDIGGGASAAVMTAALEVIGADPGVRSIFVNIFGGITRCDEVARGIVTALERVTLSAPIVLRLDGTNAEAGREILAAHRSDRLVVQPTMLDAARAAVVLAAEGGN